MSDTDQFKKPKQLNLNTIIGFVVLGATGWVGASINEGNKNIAKISERLVAIETGNGAKLEQLNRIEVQLTRQQTQINDMAIDLARMKGFGKP